jgi:hypothetical protein
VCSVVVPPSLAIEDVRRGQELAGASVGLLTAGLSLITLSGKTAVDQTKLETRRAEHRFSTVALMGAAVTSGRWYLEITVFSGQLMQVRRC